MKGYNNDILSTEQYMDMYRRLPRESSTRRQIESLLNDDVRRSSTSRYHMGGVNQSNQPVQVGNPTLAPPATQPVESGDTLSTVSDRSVNRYTPRHESFFGRDLFSGALFGDHFRSLQQRMDEQYNHMRQELFSNEDHEKEEYAHGENYAFSKKTNTHTFVDADGKRYAETNVKTDENTNGEKSTSSKRVLRKGDEEVKVIKHSDGRTQIVGNEKLLEEFPEPRRYVTGRFSRNVPENRWLRNGE